MQFRYRVFIVLVVSFFAAYVLFSSLYNCKKCDNYKINLGLDLQGGAQLLLEVDIDSYIHDQMNILANNLKKEFRSNKLGYQQFKVIDDKISFLLRNENEMSAIKKVIKNFDNNIQFNLDSDKIILTLSEYKVSRLRAQVIDQSLEIIRMRIDSLGTKEPVLQKQGQKYVLLQVPGVHNPNELKNILGQTAKLTFHLVTDESDNALVMKMKEVDSNGKEYEIFVKKQVELSGDMLIDAQATFDQYTQPAVSFEFNSLGSKLFADVTKNYSGQRFAIVLDNKLLSAPLINDPILGGKGIITGSFTLEKANELAILLRAGALPAPLNIVEERSIGPSLGVDSIESGKIAAALSLLSVILFMIWIYGFALGSFANIALICSMAYILALIALFNATLTLPGIAGIILTIGMAVDANILIYERIREEFDKGGSVLYSVKKGFDFAFATILDSNITTLIAALLLYIFGFGVIKGFAVTLSIGIISSMFSSIIITKLLVDIWIRIFKPKFLFKC